MNCKRNYPWYKGWQEAFTDKGLVILGIHTPETSSERDFSNVQAETRTAGLTFPILADTASKNWSVWGNSMWPSVYLIDKNGYVRYWWYGELKWQGNDGEKILRQRIEELIAEE